MFNYETEAKPVIEFIYLYCKAQSSEDIIIPPGNKDLCKWHSTSLLQEEMMSEFITNGLFLAKESLRKGEDEFNGVNVASNFIKKCCESCTTFDEVNALQRELTDNKEELKKITNSMIGGQLITGFIHSCYGKDKGVGRFKSDPGKEMLKCLKERLKQ